MSKRKDSATIGAFVIGALALVIAAVLVWGSGRLFKETAEFVCYFEDSVDGLETGAAVKARGVVVGNVARIQLRYRQRPTDTRIPVFIELDTRRLRKLGAVELTLPRDLDEAIARGLRARLETQSLVTGTLFVDLSLFPGSPAVTSEVDPAGGFPEIPTLPTELAEAGKSASALLTNLRSVDFAGAMRSIEESAASVERLTGAGQLPKALAEVVATMKSYRGLADHLDASLPPLITQLQAITQDARKTLVGLDGPAAEAGRLIAPQASLSVQLSEGLAEVGRAANAVRELADYLRRNPNALLVGKSR
jgi:paraquat-inducible protein B